MQFHFSFQTESYTKENFHQYFPFNLMRTYVLIIFLQGCCESSKPETYANFSSVDLFVRYTKNTLNSILYSLNTE
jgi:hypothetical protein